MHLMISPKSNQFATFNRSTHIVLSRKNYLHITIADTFECVDVDTYTYTRSQVFVATCNKLLIAKK